MASTMTHWERIRAAVRGEAVDRVPLSLWRHWPVEDETAQGLAAAMLRWQQRYDFDLVKMMPTGTYGIEDWGAETTYRPNPNGTRTVVKFGLAAPEQWPRLEQLDVSRGYLGRQVEAVRLTAEALQNSVPILQTIFSPLTTARKLAGERVLADLRRQPDLLKAGLQIIAETTARFAMESLRAGAHGFFFATQCATYRLLSEAEYREFGQQYDLLVLNAVRAEAELILAHPHGEDIMFDLAATYPVEALNWHDRRTWPSLAQARERFEGLLVGGINEWETLLNGPAEAIHTEIQEAMAQVKGRGLLLGPGCVIPTHTPEAHLRAAVAVRG